MNNNKRRSSLGSPLCSTFVFLCGSITGAYFGHTTGIKHDILVIGIATLVFHLTQITPIKLLYKKSK
jgi:hypothetical protein